MRDVFIQPLFIAPLEGSGVCFVLALVLHFVMTTETAIDRWDFSFFASLICAPP